MSPVNDRQPRGDVPSPERLKELLGRTEFMHGYRRKPEVEAALIEAVTKAIKAAPTQRFGQMVINRLGRDPWHIYDEDIIKILNGES